MCIDVKKTSQYWKLTLKVNVEQLKPKRAICNKSFYHEYMVVLDNRSSSRARSLEEYWFGLRVIFLKGQYDPELKVNDYSLRYQFIELIMCYGVLSGSLICPFFGNAAGNTVIVNGDTMKKLCWPVFIASN